MVKSKYKAMWLLAMFDLPTKTRRSRQRYTRFRKHLLDEGFHMMQYSVYARYCETAVKAHKFRRKIQTNLPPDGEVRLISITDVQFGQMEVFLGKERITTESAPPQLLLF